MKHALHCKTGVSANMDDILVIGMNQSDSGASYFFALRKDLSLHFEMEKKDMEKISSLGNMCSRMISSPLQTYKA